MNDRRGDKRDPPRCIPFLLSLLLALSLSAREGENEELNLKAMFQKGIPPSPFIGVVYRYADAMLKHGRDRPFSGTLGGNKLLPGEPRGGLGKPGHR